VGHEVPRTGAASIDVAVAKCGRERGDVRCAQHGRDDLESGRPGWHSGRARLVS